MLLTVLITIYCTVFVIFGAAGVSENIKDKQDSWWKVVGICLGWPLALIYGFYEFIRDLRNKKKGKAPTPPIVEPSSFEILNMQCWLKQNIKDEKRPVKFQSTEKSNLYWFLLFFGSKKRKGKNMVDLCLNKNQQNMLNELLYYDGLTIQEKVSISKTLSVCNMKELEDDVS